MDTTKNLSDLLGQIQQNLKCSICLELLTNPVTTKCDHNFCSFCISKFLNTKRNVPCPLCKTSVTKRSLRSSSELTVIIQGVRKLITAFEHDTGVEGTPSKEMVDSLQTLSSSSKKKSKGKSIDPASRFGKQTSSTGTGNIGIPSVPSTSASLNETRAGTSSSPIIIETSADTCDSVNNSRTETDSNFSLSLEKFNETNTNGGKTKTSSRSRRALLQYLEEGTISHPDVSSVLKSADPVDGGQGDECGRWGRKRSSDDTSVMAGNDSVDVDTEVNTSVEKPQSWKKRWKENRAKWNQQNSESTLVRKDSSLDREEDNGTGDVLVCDYDNEETPRGSKVLKRTRSTSASRKGKDKKGRTNLNLSTSNLEENVESESVEFQLKTKKKLARINSDLSPPKDDWDVHPNSTKTRSQSTSGRKTRRSKEFGKSEDQGKEITSTDISVIFDASVKSCNEVKSPASVCSVSSTQQLKHPIQPVSRTYSRKMVAAFRENDDHDKWALTKTPTTDGMSGKPEWDAVMNADDITCVRGSGDLDDHCELLQDNNKKTPIKTFNEITKEKEIYQNIIENESEKIQTICKRKTNGNMASSDSSFRRKTIFKSKNVSQIEPESNVNSTSACDLYEFPVGGTPPTLSNRKEQRRKKGNRRKKPSKVMLNVVTGFIPGSSIGTVFNSYLKKDTNPVEEHNLKTTSARKSNQSVSSIKRVHFDEAATYLEDKLDDSPQGKGGNDAPQRENTKKHQKESDGESNVLENDTDKESCVLVDDDKSSDLINEKQAVNRNENFEDEKRKRRGNAGDERLVSHEVCCKYDNRDIKKLNCVKPSARTESPSKSYAAVSTRGRRRQRVTRNGVSDLEIHEKEREKELQRMRSKIHEVEDVEFMFSTQEAQQHIANVNEQNKEQLPSREIMPAFGFESSEEFGVQKEKDDRDNYSKRKVQTNCVPLDGATSFSNVGTGNDVSRGEKNSEHHHGNNIIEKTKYGDCKKSESFTNEQEQQGRRLIDCSGDDINVACESKEIPAVCDVPVQVQQGTGSDRKSSHVMKEARSHSVIGEKDDDTAFIPTCSGSSIIKCSQVPSQVFKLRNCRKHVDLKNQFARPNLSLMSPFKPENKSMTHVDTQSISPRNKVGGQPEANGVEAPDLKSHSRCQLAKTTIDNLSPKIVMETPLSSNQCMKDLTPHGMGDDITLQRDSLLSGKHSPVKERPEQERTQELEETNCKSGLQARGPIKLTLSGMNLLSNNSNIQNVDENVDQDNICVENPMASSAVMVQDTCIDELDETGYDRKTCNLIIPETECLDSVSNSTSDEDNGRTNSDQQSIQLRLNLVTKEPQSPALFSGDKTPIQFTTELHVNKSDVRVNAEISSDAGKSELIAESGSSNNESTLKVGNLADLTANHDRYDNDLQDHQSCESQDMHITSTYTVKHKCTESDINHEEISIGDEMVDDGLLERPTHSGRKAVGDATDISTKSLNQNHKDDECPKLSVKKADNRLGRKPDDGCEIVNLTVSSGTTGLSSLDSEYSQSIFSTTPCLTTRTYALRSQRQTRSVKNALNCQQSPETCATKGRNWGARKVSRTDSTNNCSAENIEVAEAEFDRLSLNSPAIRLKKLPECQSIAESPKTPPVLAASGDKSNTYNDIERGNSQRENKRKSCPDVFGSKEEGNPRNKKIRIDKGVDCVHGSAPAKLSKVKYSSDSDDENSVLIVRRRSKRKYSSLDSVPLEPVIFGSDVVDETRSVDSKKDAVTNKQSSSEYERGSPMVKGMIGKDQFLKDTDAISEDTIDTVTLVKETIDKDTLVGNSSEDTTLNKSSNRMKEVHVHETIESTVPPSLDENQDLDESGSNITLTNVVAPSINNSMEDTTPRRKTRRGFARKENEFHKKSLVTLPNSVLPQKVKAAILREFTSQGNIVNDSCAEKGKTPVIEGNVNAEENCMLQEKLDKEGERLDPSIVRESSLSEGSSHKMSENDECLMEKMNEIDNNTRPPEKKPEEGLTPVGISSHQNIFVSTPMSKHAQLEMNPTKNSDKEVKPSPVPRAPSTKTLDFDENAEGDGPNDEVEIDRALLISSPEEIPETESHRKIDEDKKRLEQELFCEKKELIEEQKEQLEDKVSASDSESELEDLHFSIKSSLSGRSGSSQGSQALNVSQQSLNFCLGDFPQKDDSVFVDESVDNDDGNKCADSDEEEDSLASASQDIIVPPKNRKRQVIESDTEDDNTDNDLTNNNSDTNFTSSSAFSSQSEIISTQQRDALEQEVAELQQKIALCEAALQSGSRQVKSSSSSSSNSTAHCCDVEGSPSVIDKSGVEHHSDDNDNNDDDSVVRTNLKMNEDNNDQEMMSDNEDLFIMAPSPSPPERLPSRPLPVSSKPALSMTTGMGPVKSTSDSDKRFKSPGGSLHKRRPLLDFSRMCDTVEVSQASDCNDESAEKFDDDDDNEIVELVIDDSQADCIGDEGPGDNQTVSQTKARQELTNDDDNKIYIGSQSPVIYSQSGKDKKTNSQSSRDGTVGVLPHNKKICVLVVSGLNGLEMQLAQRLTKTLPNVRLSAKMLPDVTHVIMKPAADKEMVVDRTLKYFQGLARRLWIVSLQWAVRSLHAGELLPEKEFEIQGDTSGGDSTQGPYRARLAKEKLFNNYCFSCVGNSPELPKENMEELLTLSGASLVQDLLALPSSTCENKIIIYCTDADPNAMEKALLNGVYGSTRIVTVKRDWVLDSISSYKIFPLDDYLLLKV